MTKNHYRRRTLELIALIVAYCLCVGASFAPTLSWPSAWLTLASAVPCLVAALIVLLERHVQRGAALVLLGVAVVASADAASYAGGASWAYPVAYLIAALTIGARRTPEPEPGVDVASGAVTGVEAASGAVTGTRSPDGDRWTLMVDHRADTASGNPIKLDFGTSDPLVVYGTPELASAQIEQRLHAWLGGRARLVWFSARITDQKVTVDYKATRHGR